LSGRIDPADHNASLQSLIEGLECERDVHPHLGVFLDRWRATCRPAPMFVLCGERAATNQPCRPGSNDHGSPSRRLRKRRRRSLVASMPASTNSSRPRTASRACTSSAPSPRADRPKTCSAMWWRKPRSGQGRKIRGHQAGVIIADSARRLFEARALSGSEHKL